MPHFMNEQAFRQLLQRYLQGECSEDEIQLIQQWYEKIAEDFPVSLTQEEKEILEEKIWQNILEEAREPAVLISPFIAPEPAIRRGISRFFYTGIAASI